MSIWCIILNVLHVLMIPSLAGVAVCDFLSVRRSVPTCYLFGTFLEWALIQIIAVPLIFLRCSFICVVIPVTVIMFLLCGFGLYRLYCDRNKPRKHYIKLQLADWFSIVLFLAGCIALAYATAVITFKDYDDSRFVVAALDIVNTNRMLLTNPATGQEISELGGELVRDALSPWMVYNAYIAKVTLTQASITAHTVFRYSLVLCIMSVYWLLAETFFGDSVFAKTGFTFLAILVTVYGVYSSWNEECFAMTRIWQGKAVVASVGIPTVFLVFSWIHKEPDGWKLYILLYIVSFALCLMSGMGIIIGGIMFVVFGIVFGTMKRNIRLILKSWIAAIIPACYYGLTFILNITAY